MIRNGRIHYDERKKMGMSLAVRWSCNPAVGRRFKEGHMGVIIASFSFLARPVVVPLMRGLCESSGRGAAYRAAVQISVQRSVFQEVTTGFLCSPDCGPFANPARFRRCARDGRRDGKRERRYAAVSAGVAGAPGVPLGGCVRSRKASLEGGVRRSGFGLRRSPITVEYVGRRGGGGPSVNLLDSLRMDLGVRGGVSTRFESLCLLLPRPRPSVAGGLLGACPGASRPSSLVDEHVYLRFRCCRRDGARSQQFGLRLFVPLCWPVAGGGTRYSSRSPSFESSPPSPLRTW